MKNELLANIPLQTEHKEGLFPIIEIELNAHIPLDNVISTIQDKFQIPYKLLKADVEYFGKTNIGKLILLLQGSNEDTAKTLHYFQINNIKNIVKGYA